MKNDFQFKKKYGQNFLNNNGIIDKIVSAVDVKDNSLVIEVGPGSGALTEKLKDCFDHVLAYEIDNDLEEVLLNKFADSNVDLIFDDFMNRKIEDDIRKYSVNHIFFVSNLPYYITTPIVQRLIDSSIDFENIIIMVQKEVADRFSARVGTKEYNSLTVFLNYYYDIEKLFVVSRNNFYPIPNVDSAVIKMVLKDNRLPVKDFGIFFKLVRDSFQFKRKTLRNNLRDYDLDKIERVLKQWNVDLSVRAEKLSLENFVEIANALISE